MSATNGKTAPRPVTAPETPEPESYRPRTDMRKVHEEIVSSLGRIVTEATGQAGSFAELAYIYDTDAGTAIRYGHLVDACECVELALTFLGLMKSELGHRLRVEDDANATTAEAEANTDPWAFTQPRF